MQEYVMVTPPTIEAFAKKRKAIKESALNKLIGLVAGTITAFGFLVGLFTGWIFWG